MKKLNKLVEDKRINESKLLQVKSSYLGHLGYGNIKNLINKIIKKNVDVIYI